MAQSTVTIPRAFTQLGNNLVGAVEQGMNDITDDLLRVASLRAPVDTTTLEKSGTSKISKSGQSIQGTVSFSAVNRGFNYAKKLDEKSFNLGKKSLQKSSKGARSKFSGASLKVGTGYLSGTAKACELGYIKHVNEVIGQAILRSGFR